MLLYYAPVNATAIEKSSAHFHSTRPIEQSMKSKAFKKKYILLTNQNAQHT